MNVLYYAEYLHIFERCRSDFIRSRGHSYRDVESRGLFLPVREARCRYRAPAKYDDLLQVRAGISDWGRASLTFAYEVWDEEKKRLLATGATQHACVDGTGRPTPTPHWFRQMLGLV